MIGLRQPHHTLLSAALCLVLHATLCGADEPDPVRPRAAAKFTVITEACGVEKLIRDHYATYPDWWLSGIHLVDLDNDGDLDLYFSVHGRGRALSALNDGRGHFTRAPGSCPSSEILLMADLDENGTLDMTMTHQDGGARWWRNLSRPGQLRFEATEITRGTNTARRQALIDIDRDGKAD